MATIMPFRSLWTALEVLALCTFKLYLSLFPQDRRAVNPFYIGCSVRKSGTVIMIMLGLLLI